jgi:adenylate kinase family enzyme
MKKILVIGSGGSGKSTLSLKMGEILGIDVFHLDKFYWREGWIKPDPYEWLRIVDEILKREQWIIDGNFSGTLKRRVESCDTIIFLDLSRAICLWRIVMRRLRYRQRARPDMAHGCNERLNLEFVSWVMNYSKRSRPKVLELMRTNAASRKILWLRSPQQVEAFLASLERPSPEPIL